MKKLVAVAVALAALGAGRAEDKTATQKPDEPAPVIVKTQLPRYFKQLGLTDKQRKEVYRVRAGYAAKIAKLNEEIATLRLKEKGEVEGVLTEAQRKRLQEMRAGSDSKK